MLAASNAFDAETAERSVEQRAAQVWPTALSAVRDGATPRMHSNTTHVTRRDASPHSPTPTALRGDASAQAATTQPAVSSSRRSSSDSSRGVSSSRSHESVAAPRNILAAAPTEAFARRRFAQTTGTEIKTAAQAFSETSSAATETAAVPTSLSRLDKAETAASRLTPLRIGAVRRSFARARGMADDIESVRARSQSPSSADKSNLRTEASADLLGASSVDGPTRESARAPSSVLHFAQSPPRLAAVLSANLVSEAQASDVLAETKEVASSPARPRAALEETNAREANAEATQTHDDLPVETLVEELYERLRLEFLRTYGTSGE